MKFSKFNLIIPSDNNNKTLFNTLTGHCIEIENYNEPINLDKKMLDFKLGYPYHNYERSI